MGGAAMSGIILVEIVLLAILIFFAIQGGKRRRAAKVRRLEEYRASPESHLLHLND
jgi:hypothetical protein